MARAARQGAGDLPLILDNELTGDDEGREVVVARGERGDFVHRHIQRTDLDWDLDGEGRVGPRDCRRDEQMVIDGDARRAGNCGGSGRRNFQPDEVLVVLVLKASANPQRYIKG